MGSEKFNSKFKKTVFQRTMTEEILSNLFRQVNLAIEKRSKDVHRFIKIELMKGSKSVFGMTSEDFLNESVMLYLEYIKPRISDVLSYENFEGYIYIILKSRARQVYTDRYRKARTSHNAAHIVKSTFYNEEDTTYSLKGFEEIEVRDMTDKLCPSFQVVKRLIEDGASVKMVMDKFNMSARQYYNMRENLRKDITNLGYENR